MIRKPTLAAIVALALTVAPVPGSGDELALRDGHPDRYVVKPGDTLWDISGKFLEDAWRWPEIWQANQFIDNPHLIFPGDVLVLTSVDGRPGLRVLRRESLGTEKLQPTIRTGAVDEAITTIPPGVIQPFLTTPLVVDRSELQELGYVVLGVEGNILLGNGSEFYARNIVEPVSELYQLFREGDELLHPETGEYLGTEAIYLGDAELVRHGETSKLRVGIAVDEIGPGDRLIPVERDIEQPYYHPRAPGLEVEGVLLKAPRGVSEVGPFSVVIAYPGADAGLESGHVLRIRHRKPPIQDPVTREMIDLPDEDSGLMMVFRTFDQVSFGLVLKATRAIHINDVLVSPLKR